jgi:hypothetical protein
MNSRRVESRTGAVAWAMWQHSVSCPRSSNRTCRFPASGFPTSFIVRHTEKSSGRKRPLRGGFSPSPYGTAFSEGSGSRSVLPGSSPITFTSPSSKAHQKSGALPSAGITRLQRSYDPVRLPPMPPPSSDVEAATLAPNGSSPITRITLPTCRAHYPGGPRGALPIPDSCTAATTPGRCDGLFDDLVGQQQEQLLIREMSAVPILAGLHR